MTHELYDIWYEDRQRLGGRNWCLQLVNYVAVFTTERQAETYRDHVKKVRETSTPKPIKKEKN